MHYKPLQNAGGWELGIWGGGRVVRASTRAGYKSVVNTCGGDKRRDRRKTDYRFVASCSAEFNTLCVYERWDHILMV
jgi:hypothetical protein